jgi:hypothetical protein
VVRYPLLLGSEDRTIANNHPITCNLFTEPVQLQELSAKAIGFIHCIFAPCSVYTLDVRIEEGDRGRG